MSDVVPKGVGEHAEVHLPRARLAVQGDGYSEGPDRRRPQARPHPAVPPSPRSCAADDARERGADDPKQTWRSRAGRDACRGPRVLRRVCAAPHRVGHSLFYRGGEGITPGMAESREWTEGHLTPGGWS